MICSPRIIWKEGKPLSIIFHFYDFFRVHCCITFGIGTLLKVNYDFFHCHNYCCIVSNVLAFRQSSMGLSHLSTVNYMGAILSGQLNYSDCVTYLMWSEIRCLCDNGFRGFQTAEVCFIYLLIGLDLTLDSERISRFSIFKVFTFYYLFSVYHIAFPSLFALNRAHN